MSILHVNQIAGKLKPLFEPHFNLKDIPLKDAERDVKILSRSLAAYAVYNHSACSAEEAANCVVDGSDDNGIDAIFYSKISKELIFVQSKWIKDGNGEPESGEIAKFCSGIEDLINLNFDRFNEKVNDRQAEILTAISSFDTRYLIILAYTGDRGLAEHGLRRITDLLAKLNDAGEGNVEDLVRFKKFDQSKIYTSLTKGLLSDPINLEIGLHQWGKYEDPYLGYFGYLSGEEIVNLWNENGRKLFHKNIRNVLGKTDVNDEIITTIQSAPEKFWYFNNGVTIIADQIEKSLIGGTNRDLGSFKLTNASIVNGAQTISSIGESANKFPDDVKKLFVLVRCISLQNAPIEFGNEVTKANNRQNKIENRDFVSQDSEQSRIKEELAHDAIVYHISRSDSFGNKKDNFEVEEVTATLACASGQVSLAVQAKRELGKFYENLSKGIYKSIFNPSTSGRYIYNCVIINRQIEKIIAEKINSLEKKTGKEFGILVHGNRMLSFLIFTKINVSRADLMDLSKLELNIIFEDSLEKLTKAISEAFADNFLATLFKNRSKCEKLAEMCK